MNFIVSLVLIWSSLFGYTKASENEDDQKLVFCYYSSFAQSRPSVGRFLPEDIDPALCTHLIFAFVNLVGGRGLKPANWNDLTVDGRNGLYDRTLALKKRRPGLKVLLAVGGWAAGSAPFVPMISSARRRKRFIRNVIRYLRTYGFDGLDMDWEFPATRGSPKNDKYRFTYLLQELQQAFQQEASRSSKQKLLLTLATAGGTYFISKAYEPKKIIEHVDYMLLMAYNYHGSWNNRTGHHSGLYPRRDEEGSEREFNQDWTVRYWQEQGAPNSKLILGIPTYGMSFTLQSPRGHGMGAAIRGGGSPGKYTKEKGIMSYFEVCEYLDNGWTSMWSNSQQVPYAYHSNQWVGYDSPRSVRTKAEYILKQGLAGAFIWSVEMDDFRGTCGQGDYPLLSEINRVFSAKQDDRPRNNPESQTMRIEGLPSRSGPNTLKSTTNPSRGRAKAAGHKGGSVRDVSRRTSGKTHRRVEQKGAGKYIDVTDWSAERMKTTKEPTTVNSGVAFGHFGRQDTTTQISVTTKQHLNQKYLPDSDISSQSAIYSFSDSNSNSANQRPSRKLKAKGSSSKKFTANQDTQKKVEIQSQGVLSTNQIGAEVVNFGQNVNPNLNALNMRQSAVNLPNFVRPQSNNMALPFPQNGKQKEVLIYPQEVITTGLQNSPNYAAIPNTNYAQYANDMNTFVRNQFGQQQRHPMKRAEKSAAKTNSQSHQPSQRPIILLTNQKDIPGDFKDQPDVYTQEANADVEYDLFAPEVSYSFDTATRITPLEGESVVRRITPSGGDSVERRSMQRGQNQVVNDRRTGYSEHGSRVNKPNSDVHLYLFDTKSQNPESSDGFECPSPGIHRDIRSCDSYFVCVLAGRQWKVFHMQCPKDLGFDHRKKVCTVNQPCYK